MSIDYLCLFNFQGFVQWINVGREHSLDVGYIQTEILNRINIQEPHTTPPLNNDFEATKKNIRLL